MKTEQTDVLIIGAGPAGSVAAGILDKKGIKTIVVEKEIFPRFVIGESLLPRCMEAFDEAGFMEDLQSQGFQTKAGALFLKGDERCDFSFDSQFTEGWNWTFQMPRSKFDTVLTDNLLKRGVDLRFQSTVTGIEFKGTDSTTTIQDKEGNIVEINAKFIIDASGYGRVIPRLFNLDRPSQLPPKQTMLVHSSDSNRSNYQESDRIHAIVQNEKTWIWVIPFSDGSTSVGFVSDPSYFEGLEGSIEDKMRTLLSKEPYLLERFKDETFKWEPKTLGGWSVTTDKFYGDGFVLTGNVTEFLDPIFSSGVTLASVSSAQAANLVARTLEGETIDWEKDYMAKVREGVAVFKTYVMAWYDGSLHKVFFSKTIDETIKSQICSVLAGYVWDYKNPYVRKHKERLEHLVQMIELGSAK